jgi:RNA polymerase-binding transcription factor DksA
MARKSGSSKAATRSKSKAAPSSKKKATRKKTAKTPARPAARKSAAPSRPKTHLARKELNEFRQMLLELRAELVGDYNSLSDRALNHSSQDSSGNLSKMPIHMADVGTDTFNQEMDVRLLEGESRKLKLINEALDRIANGTYGICLHSGKVIPKARLRAIPFARYTVDAQEELERRGELED